MELDELKNIWNKNTEGFQIKNEAQLTSMLKGNSRSIVDKLKRSVWFELIFTLVTGILLLIYTLMLPSGALKWTIVSILVLFVVYSFYYVKKLLLLSSFNAGNDNLRDSLEKLTDRLSSYLRFYQSSYAILYPVYFGLALLFVALEIGSERFYDKISDPKWVLYLIAVALFFFLMSMFFTKWYLKKLYGNHVEKLKSLLRELNSTE
jgi:hypothetical protein